MTQLDAALAQVGVDLSGVDPGIGAALSLGSLAQDFAQQNLRPSDVSHAAQLVANSLTTRGPVAGGINSGRIAPPGEGGVWTAIHYADDLIPHQPKFKFLFKVNFIGFGADHFSYYVHRIDKPRVQLNHQDVNYYNFRTKVLTSVTFAPLTCTILDEIGNTTTDFFVSHLARMSGQASGNWGIDKGFGAASSTKPYEKAYSTAKKIQVEQIFANGLLSQRYNFINPRIESFDYDELNMEDSTQGSMLTVTFHYDALECETVQRSTINNWGTTDLLRGGGSSGVGAGGASSTWEDGIVQPTSASGLGFPGGMNPRTPQPNLAYDLLRGGIDALANIPPSLADLIDINAVIDDAGQFINSTFDTVTTNAAETLAAITSGSNLDFGGTGVPSSSGDSIDFTRQNPDIFLGFNP